MMVLSRLKSWAKALKRDADTLWLAARDPRTPIAAKLVAAIVAAYALSPIDLIPDFIPVLGYLDDLVIVPLGIAAAMRLTPPDLLAELREKAAMLASRPISRAGQAAILILWAGALSLALLALL
jgi:uncharacterized membrane protein YkvA (DUF1232 family)